MRDAPVHTDYTDYMLLTPTDSVSKHCAGNDLHGKPKRMNKVKAAKQSREDVFSPSLFLSLPVSLAAGGVSE